MTISTTLRKAGPFAGNGVQTVFPFTYKLFAAADMLAVRAVAGVETTLVVGADYSVALNGDQDANPGGSVTLSAPLAVGATLALGSDIDPLQAVVVTNGGGFFPEVFNAVFDKLTILFQQLAEKFGRAMTVPFTSSVTNLTIPVTPSAVLQWNAAGTALVAQTLPDLSLSLALPNMAGNSGKYLTNNGATANWAAVDFSSYAAKATTITGAGLATGGGDISANRVITVSGAGTNEVLGGSDVTKAATIGGIYSGLQEVALTYSGANLVTSGTTLDSTKFVNGSITLNQNTTVPNLTNPVLARSGRIHGIQDAGTARTLAFGANWKPANGVAPTVTTTLGAHFFIDYDIVTSTYTRYSLTNMG